MGSDFSYNPDKLRRQAKINAGTASGGLGASDWAGMGLQLAGGMMADKQAQQQYEEEMQRYKLQLLLDQRARDAAERARVENMQFSKRGADMNGLQYMGGLVDKAGQMGRRISFQDALAAHAGA